MVQAYVGQILLISFVTFRKALLSRPQLTLMICLLAQWPPWAVLRAASSGLEVRSSGGDAALIRM